MFPDSLMISDVMCFNMAKNENTELFYNYSSSYIDFYICTLINKTMSYTVKLDLKTVA